MGKVFGFVLLIIGLLLLYTQFGPGGQELPGRLGLPEGLGLPENLNTSSTNYIAIIGGIFSVVGLFMLIFSRPKQPRY